MDRRVGIPEDDAGDQISEMVYLLKTADNLHEDLTVAGISSREAQHWLTIPGSPK
jgi:hypothetical protein